MNAATQGVQPAANRQTLRIDLVGEWLAYPGLTGQHIRQLAKAGVTSAAWIRAGHLATPRISTAGQLFTPDPFGQPVFVLPIYDGEPVGEINPDPDIPLVDLLAFRLEEPEQWWLRVETLTLYSDEETLLQALILAAESETGAIA